MGLAHGPAVAFDPLLLSQLLLGILLGMGGEGGHNAGCCLFPVLRPHPASRWLTLSGHRCLLPSTSCLGAFGGQEGRPAGRSERLR